MDGNTATLFASNASTAYACHSRVFSERHSGLRCLPPTPLMANTLVTDLYNMQSPDSTSPCSLSPSQAAPPALESVFPGLCGSDSSRFGPFLSSNAPPHGHHPQPAAPNQRPKLTVTVWEDENTFCYQMDAKNICVARRHDNDMINGTKLLNVVGMSRGKRDGILKNEKGRVVIKVGAMHLKGVWITLARAKYLANKFRIIDLVYPLLSTDPAQYLCPSVTTTAHPSTTVASSPSDKPLNMASLMPSSMYNYNDGSSAALDPVSMGVPTMASPDSHYSPPPGFAHLVASSECTDTSSLENDYSYGFTNNGFAQSYLGDHHIHASQDLSCYCPQNTDRLTFKPYTMLSYDTRGAVSPDTYPDYNRFSPTSFLSSIPTYPVLGQNASCLSVNYVHSTASADVGNDFVADYTASLNSTSDAPEEPSRVNTPVSKKRTLDHVSPSPEQTPSSTHEYSASKRTKSD